MSRVPKLVIKENFDEEDLSDDVDDEVFVRDGKNKSMMEVEKQRGDEQPLMSARKKHKQRPNSSSPEVCNRQPCNIYNCLLPIYFGIAAIISIAFLMLLYIFVVDKLPVLVNELGWWTNTGFHSNTSVGTAPCTDFKLTKIWEQKLSELLSDSQIKMVDVDKDAVDDIVVGTGSVLEDASTSGRFCAQGDAPCLGGVLALSGKNGSVLWKLWLSQVVLAVHCDYEITDDDVTDCVVTGKQGLLLAISGADGLIIWERKSIYDYELYNVLIIRDLNEDGYSDILASYYSKNKIDVQSCIFIINGKYQNNLQHVQVPSNEPILHSPQVLIDIDGAENIIFVTGDLNHPGGLYIISMHDLLRGDQTKIKTLYHFSIGILAAPILIDVSADGIPDIIFVASNTVFAVDGATYTSLWNTSLYNYILKSHLITDTSSVTPSYFDDDEIPDLLITFPVGSVFPEYYYSVMMVLNGKNGRPVLNKPVYRSGIADTEGGITLSFSGFGNDAFIYWMSSCKNYDNSRTPFSFMANEDRLADLCGLRFNSTTKLELFALNQHVEPPGVLLKSESWQESEPESFGVSDQTDLVYPNNIQKRPSTFHQLSILNGVGNIVDDTPYYANNNETTLRNQWIQSKSKTEYTFNSFPVAVSNENLYEQPQINDYGNNNIQINGRNEKDYVVPIGSIRKRFRRKQNLYSAKKSNVNLGDKMVPKVAASGVLSKSFELGSKGVDLILMHYEIKSSNDVCIMVNKEERCSNQNKFTSSDVPKSQHYDLPPLVNEIRQRILENNPVYGASQNYNKRVSPFSNLFISRYRITCDCIYLRPQQETKCSQILPYEKQSYPAYLGQFGNSVFTKRDKFS